LPILTIALSACSTPKQVEYTATPEPKPALVLPQVTPLNLQRVDYIVVTKDNVDEVFAQMEKGGNSVVLFAMDKDGYEKLSLNMASILELVSQQKSIIASYERYYVAD
jgi:hypothetical protein